MTKCDEIVIVIDNLSTKKTNTIAITTNVTSTTSINCHSKKVRDCYLFHTVIVVVIILLIITIICYYSKQKMYNIKWKIMIYELKKIQIKNRTCYYFDDIINLEDFDFDNILIDKKSHENILIYDISYKTLIDPKPFHIRFDKINGIYENL